jgi:hypothetical protein
VLVFYSKLVHLIQISLVRVLVLVQQMHLIQISWVNKLGRATNATQSNFFGQMLVMCDKW